MLCNGELPSVFTRRGLRSLSRAANECDSADDELIWLERPLDWPLHRPCPTGSYEPHRPTHPCRSGDPRHPDPGAGGVRQSERKQARRRGPAARRGRRAALPGRARIHARNGGHNPFIFHAFLEAMDGPPPRPRRAPAEANPAITRRRRCGAAASAPKRSASPYRRPERNGTARRCASGPARRARPRPHGRAGTWPPPRCPRGRRCT